MFRLVFLCLIGLLRFAHADFTAGCDAYEAGKFAEAKKEFTALLDQGISPELAYNLGCTEVKLGNPGGGVLWFNRALLLSPRHAESLQNLRYLKTRGGVFAFDDSGYDDFARWFRPGTWPLLFWGAIWVLGLALLVVIFLRVRPLWPWITVASLAFLCSIAAAVGWSVRSHQAPARELSVVMKDELSLVNAPADTADSLISVPPGSLVRVLELRGKWAFVALPGEFGTHGWLKLESLEKLWPFAQGLIE